ncbi:MAG: hypothetical protein IR526_01160 [Bordetella sp.]|nr:MAG: hypothetical protein IR526_01160 [Bordetella sp.]
MLTYFDLVLAGPEILLLVFITIILLIDLFVSKTMNLIFSLTIFSLACLTIFFIIQWKAGILGNAFGKLIVIDELSYFLKIISSIMMIVILIYSKKYISFKDNVPTNGEFYLLALFSLLGQMITISAGNLIIIYLGLELTALSLYALIAMHRSSIAIEAAIKYFILSALSSGFLLYGMSLIYGTTGFLDIVDISDFLKNINALKEKTDIILVFGVILVVCSLAFKLSLAPFHMWAPDVYEGSATSITLILASIAKFLQ